MIAMVLLMTLWSVLPGQATTSAPQTAGAPKSPATQPAASAIQTPGAYRLGKGITPPVLVKEFRPQYTASAMRAEVQGTVGLDCVVGIDGHVGEVRVTRSLDAGLDEEAIKAARRWIFKPGMKDGQAVPVVVEIELTFTLRDKRQAPAIAPSFNAGPPPTPAPAPSPTPVSVSASAPLRSNLTAGAEVYTPGQGVSAPVATKQARPAYTAEAKAAGIQGSVMVDCVVEIDGTVGDVVVIRPLDPGLDEEAIKAAKQWRFKPGTKDGKPVPVRITLELTFSLR